MKRTSCGSAPARPFLLSMVTGIKVKGSFFGMDYARSSSKCKIRHKTMAERVDAGHHFENIGTQAGQDEGSCSQTKLRQRGLPYFAMVILLLQADFDPS